MRLGTQLTLHGRLFSVVVGVSMPSVYLPIEQTHLHQAIAIPNSTSLSGGSSHQLETLRP
jgi:hypothetical protein